MAHIIFLHGASSSGKTTIARRLQARIEKPFWHISIDHLRDAGVLPSERFKNGDFRWADAKPAFFDGFHRSLKAHADAGNNLILEHILDTEGWLEQLVGLLAGHDVFFVAVHCPLPRLIEREAIRGDRPLGSAEQDFHTIHVGRHYDMELQSEDGVDENVELILLGWTNPHRSSDFSPRPSRSAPL